MFKKNLSDFEKVILFIISFKILTPFFCSKKCIKIIEVI